MSRRRGPIREGPLPDLQKILLPDRAHPVFQAKVLRLATKLIEVLNQVAPPAGDRPPWQHKYNAKMFPDMLLVRSPEGAGQPVTLEHLDNLSSAADWDGFARKLAGFLDVEYRDCMEQQTKSETWHALNNFKTTGTLDNPVER